MNCVCLWLIVMLWAALPAFCAESTGSVADNTRLLNESRFQAPGGWQWKYFDNGDGARIRYGFVRSPNCKGSVVLVTGFTDTGETYYETIREFMAHDFDVWEMDWRGQGGSDRYLADKEKSHTLGTDHDEADLAQFVALILKEHPKRPLILVAHSFGGLISLRYLHDHPNDIDMAVLGAPALSLVENAPTWMSRLVISTMVHLGLGESYGLNQGDWYHMRRRVTDPAIESHDPERLELQSAWFDKKPELIAGGATWAWAHEFQKTGLLVTKPKYLRDIHTPILIGSALADKIADPDVHKEVCSNLPKATLLAIPDARHCIFHESDEFRKPWMNAIFEFIERETSANAKHAVVGQSSQ